MVTRPQILIISNTFDFSTDLVTNKLHNTGTEYLRLNRDQLGEYQIDLDPITPALTIHIDRLEYQIEQNSLQCVYYRAPTFLRDIFQDSISEEEQLFRTQWAAFIRALAVFEKVKWVNNPIDTYKAELKPLQLHHAHKLGLKVPHTIVSNSISKSNGRKVAIKSIDTAIINKKDYEAFIYTTILDSADLETATYSSPFFVQEALIPKIDIRITIIGNNVIAIRLESNEGIDDDWRKYKGDIQYKIFPLPEGIKERCFALVKYFNLHFAAIDMIMYNEEYYFIEINPTGEWSWLQKNTGFHFDELIAKCLCNE